MKKLNAIGVISIAAATASSGLFGLSAGAASAAPPITAEAQVCSSATAQFSTLQPVLFYAALQEANAEDALTAANSAVTTAESAYITSAMTVVTDVDSSATSQQTAADTTAFNLAVTTFVKAVVTQSTDGVTDFNATEAVAPYSLEASVLNTLKTDSC